MLAQSSSTATYRLEPAASGPLHQYLPTGQQPQASSPTRKVAIATGSYRPSPKVVPVSTGPHSQLAMEKRLKVTPKKQSEATAGRPACPDLQQPGITV